jgi:hypothetical protein
VDLKGYRPDATFLSEVEEEIPGWYVNVNWDDDDKDGWTPDDHSPSATYTPDKDDILISGNGCTEDDDLWKFTVEIVPSSIHGPIRLTFNEAKVKVYVNRTKQNPFASGNTVNFTGQPITLYLEGQTGTENFYDSELKGQYAGTTPTVVSDKVVVTVFDCTLNGLFDGQQQGDCEKKHKEAGGSNNRDGKISCDDANGNGTTGDLDGWCKFFHNTMEDQGILCPRGIRYQAEFDFKREVRRRVWRILTGEANWRMFDDKSTRWFDDENQYWEDNTPSVSNHIYQIDGPGIYDSTTQVITHIFGSCILRDWVMVRLYGTWYRCSDFLRWHSQCYVKARTDDPALLRRAGAGPGGPTGEWNFQKHGSGWIQIPDNPPAP